MHGGEADDIPWQNELVDYFIDKRICNFFYWSWNPNSGDTGGILQDDWSAVWQDKVDNLSRLMTVCRDDLASSNPTSVPALASSARALLLIFVVAVALFEVPRRRR